MDVVVASHPSALLHDTGPWHPERPERVEAVLRGIDESGFTIRELTSPTIERSELALVHDPSYIEMIERFCDLGGGALDMDTPVSKDSWEAALTAAGGVRAVVEELADGSGETGFVVARPPGHHAMRARAMGFCIFNNVAVTGAYLRSRGERVAILDWDVHHGNGTQDMTADDPGVLYVSIHQSHFYPFAGYVDDIDRDDGKGTVINIPLPAWTAGDIYRRAWGELVIPVVTQFEPDWVLVSAGFDSHVDDQLAEMRLVAEDYGWMSSQLAKVHDPQHTVFVLEGGYNLAALETSTVATLRGAGGEGYEHPRPWPSPDKATVALSAAAEAIARHWAV